MLLQVDVELLIKNKITIDQFLIATLIYEKNYEVLSKYLELYSSEDMKIIFHRLIGLGLIHNNISLDQIELDKIIITPFLSRILAQGDFFDELVQHFPVSVIRPNNGGKDYLRTDLNRCRKLYSRITGNKSAVHDHILTCLRYEVQKRYEEGSLGYMKRIPKWLASEEWIVYEQMLKDETTSSNKSLGYGNELY